MKADINILLVEDNPGDRDLIMEMLSEWEGVVIEIKALPTLAEALNWLDTGYCDLILLDISLPDSDGIHTVKSMYDRCRNIPIVVMTGLDDEKLGLAAISQGAQDYLVKGKTPKQSLWRVMRYAIQRKQTEERLRHSETRFRNIVNNLAVGIILINENREIVEVNEQVRTWFPDVLQSLPIPCRQFCERIYEAVDCDNCLCMTRISDGALSKTFTKKAIFGPERVLKITVSALSKDTGESKGGYVYVMEDITDQLRMETKLRQAQKMESLGTLAGGIAHDFNNILTAILGYSQLIGRYTNDKSPAHRDAKEIHKAGLRAADLVNQILAFSRQSEKKLRPVFIGIIIKEALKLLRSTIPTSIEIKSSIKNSTLKVLSDPTNIHQIIMNLCTNAAHAMEPNGGTLTVETREIDLNDEDLHQFHYLEKGPHVLLAVEDTGCGIPPELMDSIFDPYFTTKDFKEGTGLGLAVVHGIVKDSRGEITVETTSGKGSRFMIYFPGEKADTDPAPGRNDPEQYDGSERILFVDDEAAILKLGARLLESHGYRVTTEISSTKALAMIQSDPEKFDLVISDMTMPQMTGDKLLVEINKVNPDLPLVLCTGYNKYISPKEAAELGFDAMIKKPFYEKDLIGIIREILDKK